MAMHESQRGAAAIELAFSMILLLMLFFAIISYGALFWAQQKLSHLAGEGARIAVAAHFQSQEPSSDVRDKVYTKVLAMKKDDFLLESLGGFGCALYGPGVDGDTACGEPCPVPNINHSYTTLTVCGKVHGWPLLDMMRSLTGLFGSGASQLVPEILSADAVVQLKENTEP